MTRTTSTHLTANRTAPAYIRRQEIAKAAAVWGASCPTDDEAGIAFDAVLLICGVIQSGEFIDEIWQDCPESPVCILINGSEIIKIDSEGNTLRGSVE